jgi:hypothetical protein
VCVLEEIEGWVEVDEKLKDDDDDEDEVCNNSILHNRLINSTVGLRDKVFYFLFIIYFNAGKEMESNR